MSRKTLTPEREQLSRALLAQFLALPDEALASSEQVAAYLDCTVAKLERDRWAGTGLAFTRIGRRVRYRKRDVFVAAQNDHLLAFDNVSYIPPSLSDVFCQLATRGGFASRRLYTDMEETLIDVVRPVILNGIEYVVMRHDLMERALFLRLSPISEEHRRTEEELWPTFEAEHPRILGALLDLVSEGLRRIYGISLSNAPRMVANRISRTQEGGA